MYIRFLLPLAALIVATPGHAGEPDAPYYGPMKAWKGIGYKFGYKDEFRPDGTWRVVASVRSGEALDMAMYRMAERAQDAGYPYIELLGGSGLRSPGYQSATLNGRPTRSPAPPATCPSKDGRACYTASVAALLRVFGGAGGAQPGVALPDSTDQFGRRVYHSSYGKGVAAAAPAPPAPVPVPRAPRQTIRATAELSDYEKAMKANEPVRGRNAELGWTISD